MRAREGQGEIIINSLTHGFGRERTEVSRSGEGGKLIEGGLFKGRGAFFGGVNPVERCG